MTSKTLRIALAAFLFTPSLHPRGTFTPNWIHSWGGTGTESGSAVATDSSGNAYVVGSTSSFGAGGQDVLLLKYDSSGNQVWARTWGGPSNEFANGVLADSSGNIYVVGGTQSFGVGSYDVLVLKFDASGNLVWTRTWGGGSFDVGYDLSFDQFGNLVIAAESYSFGNCTVLLKMSTDGALLSASTWKGPASYDSAYSVTVDSTGNTILTGISWDYSVNPEHNTILILKYDAQGNLLWNRNWAGPGEDETNGRKTVRTDSQGNIYVVGRTCINANSCSFDALILKIDPNGNLIWSKQWGGTQNDAANALFIDASNNLDVVGSTADSANLPTALIQQYDSNGNLLLSKQVTHGPIEPTELWSIAANSNGGFVSSGNIEDNTGASELGAWQDTGSAVTNALGSLSTPAGTVNSPIGNIGTPQGETTSPVGVVDIGDGGQAVMIVGFRLGSSTGSCQEKPAQTFHQYENAPTYPYQPVMQYPPILRDASVPQYFGFLPPQNTSIASPYVLCPTIETGCALTSEATMLTSFSSLANVTPVLLDCELRGDCGGKTEYGVGRISLCPKSSPNCSSTQATSPYQDWCEASWSGLQHIYPMAVQWVGSQDVQNDQLFDKYQSALVPVEQYLDDYVCKHQSRIILQLSEYDNGTYAGQHYVYVTGQSTSGSDWDLADPGWSDAALTLHEHEAGFMTGNCSTGDCTLRRFTVSGVRTYQDVSAEASNGTLSVIANSPVELLMLDPQGRRLGNVNGADVFEIPDGSYVRDFPRANDRDTGSATGDISGIKTVNAPSPLAGVYQVVVTGTGLGTFTLTFKSLAADGSLQSATLVGVTSTGTISTYQVLYSPAGPSGPVTQIATFQSTLADISNCLALGLIDNQDLANALSSKINAAASSTGSSKAVSNILAAFVNMLNAQTGKHLIGIAPQILLGDANSLMAQLE